MTNVKPIQDDYQSITPYLFIKGADQALAFYKKVFNAKEVMCMRHEGKISHCEIKIGDSKLMLADEFPKMNVLSPLSIGGSGVMLHLYVENVDEIFNLAVENGAKAIRPVADQFYGDRTGGFIDPFGHLWTVATHVEDVSDEEIRERGAKVMKDCS